MRECTIPLMKLLNNAYGARCYLLLAFWLWQGFFFARTKSEWLRPNSYFIKCKQYGTHTRPPATATAIFRVSHGGVLHVGHIFTYISSHRERDQILQAGQKAKTIHATQLRAPRAICASRPSIILLELSNDTARTATANTILSQSFSRLAVLVAACVAKYVFSDFSHTFFFIRTGFHTPFVFFPFFFLAFSLPFDE